MFHQPEPTHGKHKGGRDAAGEGVSTDGSLLQFPPGILTTAGERLRNLEVIRQEAERSNNKVSAAYKLSVALAEAASAYKPDKALRARLRNSWSPEYKALMNTAGEVINLSPNMSASQLGRVLESMALLGFRDEAVFQTLGHELVSRHKRKLDVLGPDMGRAMWAFAALDIQDAGLIRNFVKIVQSIDRHKYLEISDRAKIGWSLILLGPAHTDRVLSSSFLTDFERTSSLRAWGQMYQALLVGEKINQYEQFSRRKDLWGQKQQDGLNEFESRVQSAIESHLRHIPHVLEPHQNVAGVLTDFVLYLEDRTIAIECDGYHYHYSFGPDGDRRLGEDIIQEHVLKACGLEVVHISSVEWRTCGANQLLSEKFGILS
jgi:hypothetical protein